MVLRARDREAWLGVEGVMYIYVLLYRDGLLGGVLLHVDVPEAGHEVVWRAARGCGLMLHPFVLHYYAPA
jgi:hypothetical protein